MVPLIPVQSSNIEAVGHDPATSTLFVKFLGGRQFAYKDVPVTVYGAMLQADSVGNYFARSVKGKFAEEDMGCDAAPVAVAYDHAVECPGCGQLLARSPLDHRVLTCAHAACVAHGRRYKAPARRVELEVAG